MSQHRLVKVVAGIFFVAAFIGFLAAIFTTISIFTNGLGAGWGMGWRGWILVPTLACTLPSAIGFLVVGAILFFLARTEANTRSARLAPPKPEPVKSAVEVTNGNGAPPAPSEGAAVAAVPEAAAGGAAVAAAPEIGAAALVAGGVVVAAVVAKPDEEEAAAAEGNAAAAAAAPEVGAAAVVAGGVVVAAEVAKPDEQEAAAAEAAPEAAAVVATGAAVVAGEETAEPAEEAAAPEAELPELAPEGGAEAAGEEPPTDAEPADLQAQIAALEANHVAHSGAVPDADTALPPEEAGDVEDGPAPSPAEPAKLPGLDEAARISAEMAAQKPAAPGESSEPSEPSEPDTAEG